MLTSDIFSLRLFIKFERGVRKRCFSVLKSKELTIFSRMKAIKLRDTAFDLFNVGLRSVTPHTMVMNSLQVKNNILSVNDQSYALDNNVYIVAFGKAVIGMVKTAEDILGEHVVKGIASVPHGIQSTFKTLGKWFVVTVHFYLMIFIPSFFYCFAILFTFILYI